MKRLLVVSPHFPPTNAADMQRVRLLLHHWKQQGMDVEVLACDPKMVAAPIDTWLSDGLLADLSIQRVQGLGLMFRQIPGLGTLTNRAFGALKKVGSRQLAVARREGRPFDMVYFSTTQFGIHLLGPYWKKKFDVPFVMDYQDPWVNDYYALHPEIVPPGGRLKYAIAHCFAKRMEPFVLKECSGITSVSTAYPEQLRNRYAFLRKDFPVLVAPFPGDIRDIERVRADSSITQSVFDPEDDLIHWVYIGRGGADMQSSLRGLFHALKSARGGGAEDTSSLGGGWIPRLRLHFIGTSYASSGRGIKSITPIAQEFGMDDIVEEHTDRIPYSQTIRCLLDADALLVLGSNDPGYTASKIYPYLLVEKPLLAIFHQQSSVVQLLKQVGGGTVVDFDELTSAAELGDRVKSAWFDTHAYRKAKPLDMMQFDPFTARAQAQTLTKHFELCLKR